MKLAHGLATAALSTLVAPMLATAAFADEPRTGFYVGGAIGSTRLDTLDLTDTVVGFGTNDYFNSFDNGTAYLGVAGYSFGNGLRAEFELSRRDNDLSEFGDVVFGPIDGVTGGFTTTSGIVNLLYDFQNQSSFTPYLGAGLGVARTNGEVSRPSGIFDESSTGAAYQAILGASYNVSPSFEIFGQYTYFVIPDLDLSGPLALPATAATVTLDYNDDYVSQTFWLGARYRF